MKLETFFEKFEVLAEMPGAVGKLRELVLELAMKGKLVEQDASEENACEVLNQIQSTKELMIKQRIIKRVSIEPNPKGDSCNPLPIGWLWTRLGSVFDVRDGTHDTPKYVSDGYPLITSKNIYSGRLSFDETNLISEKDHRRICERSRVDRDDILFAMIGSIGNPAIVDTDQEFSIKNVALFKYYSKAYSEPGFLLLYLKRVSAEMKAKAAGGVQSFVSLGYLRNYPFPLPPLGEQKRIVAKVGELMALCDRLEAQHQERETRHTALARASLTQFAQASTPANLSYLFHPTYSIAPDDLRNSILSLAFQGKLVHQDPDDEPAEELLERVKAAKEALVLERRIRQSDEVEYSHQDEEDDAPPGWIAVHVNDVAIVQGGKRLPNGAVFSESATPHVYIRVTDMKNGTISEAGLRYISPEVHGAIARYIINKEDLYITIAGTIGDVGCVPEALDGHNLTENAAKIVFKELDRRFLQLALTSEFVQAQFLEKTKQMAQPKLALKRIAGAKFHLPPLAEQRRIVARIEQLMALVDEFEKQLADSRAAGTKLLNARIADLAVEA